MHFVYPPPPQKKKNCITIVSNFSWVLQSPQEKSNGYATCWGGGGGGGQTRYIMAYVEIVNSEHFCQSLGPSLFRGSIVS